MESVNNPPLSAAQDLCLLLKAAFTHFPRLPGQPTSGIEVISEHLCLPQETVFSLCSRATCWDGWGRVRPLLWLNFSLCPYAVSSHFRWQILICNNIFRWSTIPALISGETNLGQLSNPFLLHYFLFYFYHILMFLELFTFLISLLIFMTESRIQIL